MKEYKVNDICSVKSSKRIYARDYVESGIPFFRGKEITEMSLNKSISEVLYISEGRFAEIDKKFGSPKVGDILMTAVGTIGNVWEVEYTPIYFKDGNLIWFTDFNRELINPKYLKILFNSSWFQMLLFNKGSIGSVQSALTIEKVKRINIPLPSLDVQFSIVEKISKLSDLNKKNYELIAGIEEYSQLLFHKWFVDFNFPGENGNPYKDSGGELVDIDGKIIPRGWRIDNLKNLTNRIQSGGTPSTKNPDFYDGDINWFTTKELNDNFLSDSEKNISQLAITKSNAKIFPKDSILMAIYASPTVGRLGILMKEAAFNQAAVGIVTNEDLLSREFVYLYLKSKRKEFNQGSIGACQQNLSLKFVENHNCFLPNDKINEKFRKITRPLFKKIESLYTENKLLEETRDLLIKKLIK